MKASQVATAVAALLATDAKPSETQILAAILAADKKAKDEGGLGPVEIQNKKKAEDEFPEEKKKAEDEKEDKEAEDAEKDDPEATNDEDMDAEDDVQPKQSVSGAGAPAGNAGKKPAQDKKAMDAAIGAALAARDALHTARREVEPIIGVVTFDTAADVYKAALDKLGVATDGVHASAFPAMLKLAKDKAAPAVMASDSAAVSDMTKAIPGYGRLR
jgi:uncharacterized protein